MKAVTGRAGGQINHIRIKITDQITADDQVLGEKYSKVNICPLIFKKGMHQFLNITNITSVFDLLASL